MDKGIVITAFNNGDVDYHLIAEANSLQIKNYVDLPVTVITDEPWDSRSIDSFVVADAGPATSRHDQSVKTDAWLNQYRYQVYDLSPYDQTLLIDADFFIGNQRIFRCFDTDHEFLIAGTSTDIMTGSLVEPNRISPVGPWVCWATAVYFRKCDLTKDIFRRVNLIRETWDFYQTLYQFNSRFRNDYAFAIALHEITHGRTPVEHWLPDTVDAVMPNQEITYRAGIPWVCYQEEEGHVYSIQSKNVHILDKKQAETYARWVLDNV